MNLIRLSPAVGVAHDQAPFWDERAALDMLDGEPGIVVVAPYREVKRELREARQAGTHDLGWESHWCQLSFHMGEMAAQIGNLDASPDDSANVIARSHLIEASRLAVSRSYVALREMEVAESTLASDLELAA